MTPVSRRSFLARAVAAIAGLVVLPKIERRIHWAENAGLGPGVATEKLECFRFFH